MFLDIKPHCSIRAKRDISFHCHRLRRIFYDSTVEPFRTLSTADMRLFEHALLALYGYSATVLASTETHDRSNHSTTVIARSVRNKTLDSHTHRFSNTYKAYRVCECPSRMYLRIETPHSRNSFTGYI